MNCRHLSKFSVVLALSAAGWGLGHTFAAQGATINVQFEGTGVFTGQQGSFSGNQGAYTGDGVAAPVWNVLSEPASATSGYMNNLLTSNNVATNVDVSFANNTSTYGDPTTPPNALLGGTLIASSGHTGDVTLTGLAANGSYTLYIYGQNGGYNSDITTYAITEGSGGPATGQFDETIDGGSSSGTFYNNSSFNNYTIFNATADSSGALQISFTGGTPGVPAEGVFNGLQLVGVSTATPEPAAIGLLAVGAGLPLLSRRFRRA
jgi:hypothetical protein